MKETFVFYIIISKKQESYHYKNIHLHNNIKGGFNPL